MKLSDHLSGLSQDQLLQLEELAEVFVKKNQQLNLSAIRDRDGVLLKHVLDSLLICPYEIIQPGDAVLDMGTGGGFPGLALAIAYPKASFTLVDATAKKVRAVEEMAKTLGLENVRCLAGRAEELGHDTTLREHFDVVVARALAAFPTLLEYCLPFVKVGGKFVAYQGPELADTWKASVPVAQELSSGIIRVERATLPQEKAERSFIILKKMRRLSQRFPRAVGVPKKKPLAF